MCYIDIRWRYITSKTATVRARIEPDLKEEVENLFHELGLSTTDAINIFYKQVKLRHGFPFEVAVPNKFTEKVLKETDEGGQKSYPV